MSKFRTIVENVLLEGKILRLDHLNPDIITKCMFIINPTKPQFEMLLNKDKYHTIRAFITEDNELYCWQGFLLTHQEALNTLLKNSGIVVKPIIGLVLNDKYIEKANSWKNKNITTEQKDNIKNNQTLRKLYGNNYTIINL